MVFCIFAATIGFVVYDLSGIFFFTARKHQALQLLKPGMTVREAKAALSKAKFYYYLLHAYPQPNDLIVVETSPHCPYMLLAVGYLYEWGFFPKTSAPAIDFSLWISRHGTFVIAPDENGLWREVQVDL